MALASLFGGWVTHRVGVCGPGLVSPANLKPRHSLPRATGQTVKVGWCSETALPAFAARCIALLGSSHAFQSDYFREQSFWIFVSIRLRETLGFASVWHAFQHASYHFRNPPWVPRMSVTEETALPAEDDVPDFPFLPALPFLGDFELLLPKLAMRGWGV